MENTTSNDSLGTPTGSHREGRGPILTAGDLRPYGFLKQIPIRDSPQSFPEEPPFGSITVMVRAIDSTGSVAPATETWEPDWEWEIRTSDNEIRQQCDTRWLIQTQCDDGLTSVQVSPPEGEQLSQPSPIGTFLSGTFLTQGFSAESIKARTLAHTNTNPAEGLPPQFQGLLPIPPLDEDITGEGSDAVRLTVHCGDLLVAGEVYRAKSRLRVLVEQ